MRKKENKCLPGENGPGVKIDLFENVNVINFFIFNLISVDKNAALVWRKYQNRNYHGDIKLGPLNMSPVDRADSVSEISPRHSFLYKNFNVFISEGRLARLPRSQFLRLRSR